MRLETMQPADFAAIRRLSESLGRNSRPELFGNDECQLVLKNSQGQLVGWARAAWWDPSDDLAPAGYYLSGIEIAREHQGRGLARLLSHERLSWIADRADDAWCVVNARNEASLALQRSLGFSQVLSAARIGSIEFTGGQGFLLRKKLAASSPASLRQHEQGK